MCSHAQASGFFAQNQRWGNRSADEMKIHGYSRSDRYRLDGNQTYADGSTSTTADSG
tara:strand:+ start:434 stop:604 length:171 start_codon:yes stop_codon:yes gene_type:complete